MNFDETLAAVKAAAEEAQRVRFRKSRLVPRKVRTRQQLKAVRAYQASLYEFQQSRRYQQER